MSDDKLKQNHVFVKNNVGSLALHKAKQEIGGKKMSNDNLIKDLFQLKFDVHKNNLYDLEDELYYSNIIDKTIEILRGRNR